MSLRVYVAGGSTERLTVVRPMMNRLRSEGIVITHDWTACEGYDRGSTLDERRAWAEMDLEGVRSADLVWIMVPEVMSVGAAVEMGAALTQRSDKLIMVSGPRNECIFYNLCNCFAKHEDAFAEILALDEDCGDVE